MFEQTVQELKDKGLIVADDLVVACGDFVTSSFGVIGAAIASVNAKNYLLVANKDVLRLFDVDKKTGAYLGTCSTFTREEIVKTKVGSFINNYTITIKTTTGKLTLNSSPKYKKYYQKEALAALKRFLNEK